MILTVFRSRLNEEAREEYNELSQKISDLAEQTPGFKSKRSYTADDGERLSIVEFEDEESHRNWAENIVHQAAKDRAREHLYTEYMVQVCHVVKESKFQANG